MNPMKIDNGQTILWHDTWAMIYDEDGHLLEVRMTPGDKIDDVYTSPDPYIKVDENGQPCGISWLVDLRLGAVVFAGAFGLTLLALWVFR
jgi:hypothetical protein